MRIKIFQESLGEAETIVNNWIKSNNNINVKDIHTNLSGCVANVCVIYEESVPTFSNDVNIQYCYNGEDI